MCAAGGAHIRTGISSAECGQDTGQVYLQKTEAGDTGSLSFYGQACSLLINRSWEHTEPPGVGPWLFQRTVPDLLCTLTHELTQEV